MCVCVYLSEWMCYVLFHLHKLWKTFSHTNSQSQTHTRHTWWESHLKVKMCCNWHTQRAIIYYLSLSLCIRVCWDRELIISWLCLDASNTRFSWSFTLSLMRTCTGQLNPSSCGQSVEIWHPINLAWWQGADCANMGMYRWREMGLSVHLCICVCVCVFRAWWTTPASTSERSACCSPRWRRKLRTGTTRSPSAWWRSTTRRCGEETDQRQYKLMLLVWASFKPTKLSRGDLSGQIWTNVLKGFEVWKKEKECGVEQMSHCNVTVLKEWDHTSVRLI